MGLLETMDIEEPKERVINNNVSSDEQETNISYMRNEPFAKIYTSDSTQITRLDKLCKESPEFYQLDYDTGRGKGYILKDKSLISFRSKKTTRTLTEEQKKAAAERFAKARASKKS